MENRRHLATVQTNGNSGLRVQTNGAQGALGYRVMKHTGFGVQANGAHEALGCRLMEHRGHWGAG